VRVVSVGIDKANGNGFGAFLFQRSNGPFNIGFVERRKHLAVVGDTLLRLKAQVAGDERGGFGEHKVE
jgi:hypothetical protein